MCTDDYNTQVYVNRIVHIHRLHYVEKSITVTLATGSNNSRHNKQYRVMILIMTPAVEHNNMFWFDSNLFRCNRE